MKLNAATVYSAYLAGYLGCAPPPEDELEPLAAYALGVYQRGEPSREPEPLAAVVRKVEKLLLPVAVENEKDTSWFTDPSGARLRRTKGTR